MTEKVCFQIEGEFITDLARTWFWDENKDYDVCENLLLQCLVCDQLTEDDMKAIALQILEGRKKLVGVNEFTLEDDGENIRPVHLKIKENYRKLKIAELKHLMSTRMIDFVDPFCTTVSLRAARELGKVVTYEQCMAWFWYENGAIDHTYMRPLEPGNGMLVDEEDDTDAGLWLYNHPEIAYDAMKMHDTYPTNEYEKDTFWRDVYNLINDTFPFRSKYFQNRNERYLASLRVKKNILDCNSETHTYSPFNRELDATLKQRIDETLAFTNEWIKKHGGDSVKGKPKLELQKHEIELIDSILRDDSYMNHIRMYLIRPDDYDTWEGLISPNGDFYSCDFGGHNAKAYFIMAVYPEKFPNLKDERIDSLDMSTALDEILKHGWCATRYLPTCGSYIQLPENGRVTKAQKDAIFDAKVKHDISVDLSPIGY